MVGKDIFGKRFWQFVEEAENREEMSRNVKAESHKKSLDEKENVRYSN